MVLDVVPWMIYGVSSDDQTTFAERIEAFEKSGVVDKAAQIYGAISDPTGTITQTIGALPPNSQMTGLLNALQAARQTP
jgi:alkyl hydroperoxide reductase subunit AhpC